MLMHNDTSVRTGQGRLDEAAHLFRIAGGFAFVTALVSLPAVMRTAYLSVALG